MDIFGKAVAVVLLAVILSITIGKTEKDIAVVLTMIACSIIAAIAMYYLSDIFTFLWKLGNSNDYQNSFMGILLSITGVALISELTCLVSADAGNTSLGKAMQILGNAVILFLSLPLFESLFTVIQEIMRIA